jgi:hypothetical protein
MCAVPYLQAAAALAEFFVKIVLIVAKVNTTIKCIGVFNHLFQREPSVMIFVCLHFFHKAIISTISRRKETYHMNAHKRRLLEYNCPLASPCIKCEQQIK